MPTREYQHVTLTGNAGFVFVSVTDTQLHSLVCTVCGCCCAAAMPGEAARDSVAHGAEILTSCPSWRDSMLELQQRHPAAVRGAVRDCVGIPAWPCPTMAGIRMGSLSVHRPPPSCRQIAGWALALPEPGAHPPLLPPPLPSAQGPCRWPKEEGQPVHEGALRHRHLPLLFAKGTPHLVSWTCV